MKSGKILSQNNMQKFEEYFSDIVRDFSSYYGSIGYRYSPCPIALSGFNR